MRSPREFVLDTWSSLSHKIPLRDDNAAKVEAKSAGFAPETWMGEEHFRRLAAYNVLTAYDSNVSREFLDGSDADRDERREYGDAALVIDQTLAHLLGEDQEIVVPGAEQYDPELDTPPADGEKPEELNPETAAANARARRLADLQDFLRSWGDDEHLQLRMVDCERNAVRSGDGVYLLGWSDTKNRPTVITMDPGFYFPVLPDSLDSYAYPERVHFAWEIPEDPETGEKTKIRRITYDLRDLELIELDDGTEVLPVGTKVETIRPADRDADPVTRIVRQYPWAEKPSPKTCYLTDATWILDDLNDAHNVDAFDLAKAEIATDEDGNELLDLDLEIDFVPIVHIPNAPSGGDHYGQSSLARVLQLLDDLQAADTDAQAASALTGSPIIGISGNATTGDNVLTGQRGQRIEVAPGLVLRLGENGRMDALDTSANLQATRDYVQSLRDRLSVNSRLPAAVLGMLKPSEVPSGFAMQLSFGPLSSMIRIMRLVRDVKYALMLKFVVRLYQANGELLDLGTDTPRAVVQLGRFLPSDQAAVLELVTKARGAEPPLMSLETAVTELLNAGIEIDDVAEEILRIEARDFTGAGLLVDVTGDPADGRRYLGMPEPSTAEGQPIAGGTGTGQPSPSDSGAGA